MRVHQGLFLHQRGVHDIAGSSTRALCTSGQWGASDNACTLQPASAIQENNFITLLSCVYGPCYNSDLQIYYIYELYVETLGYLFIVLSAGRGCRMDEC